MLLITFLFFCSHCCGLTVTVGYNGPVAEGSDARLTCNHTTRSVASPVFRWQELINGSPVLISIYQNGFGSVEPNYMNRFSVEGDSTLVIANNSRSDNGRIFQCEVTVIGDSPSLATDELTLSVTYFIDACASEPCENGGTCSVVEGGYSCKCTADFSGLNCSNCIYKDGCDLYEGDNLYIYGNGTCECICGADRQYNYITSRCEISPCADEPCFNGGTCSVFEGGYNCKCTDHFNGLNCTNCIYKSGCDLDKGDTYYSNGNGVCGCYCSGCRQFDKNTNRCETCSVCSSSTGLTIGIFFVGIIVGVFGVIGILIGYTRIIQKRKIEKRSTDKRKQNTYMDFTADKPTAGNENQAYQDLQYREEETAYVNVKAGKR